MILHGVLRFRLQQQITVTSTAANPASTGRHTMSAAKYTATVKAVAENILTLNIYKKIVCYLRSGHT